MRLSGICIFRGHVSIHQRLFEDFSAGFDRINLIDGLTFVGLTIEQGDTSNVSRIRDATTGDLLAVLSTTPLNTISASNFF